MKVCNIACLGFFSGFWQSPFACLQLIGDAVNYSLEGESEGDRKKPLVVTIIVSKNATKRLGIIKSFHDIYGCTKDIKTRVQLM